MIRCNDTALFCFLLSGKDEDGIVFSQPLLTLPTPDISTYVKTIVDNGYMLVAVDIPWVNGESSLLIQFFQMRSQSVG